MITIRIPMTLLLSAMGLAGWLTVTATAAAAAAPRATPVTACAFTPDGSSLAVAHQDSVTVRAASDGSLRQTLTPALLQLPRISALAFSPDGKLLAVAGGSPGVSGRVVLWDWGKAAAASAFDGFDDLVTSVAFAPNGAQLAVTSADHSTRAYHVRDGGRRVELAARLTGHAGPVHAAAFGPRGATLVTVGADRSVKVWDSRDGRLLRSLGNHTAAVNAVAVRPPRPGDDPAGAWASASAGDDRTVRVWQPEVGRMVRIMRKHDGPVTALAYARGGTVLLSAGAEGVVRAIDADGDQVLFQWKASDDWIYGLAVSPDGKAVATGDWAGVVRVWDLGEHGAPRRW